MSEQIAAAAEAAAARLGGGEVVMGQLVAAQEKGITDARQISAKLDSMLLFAAQISERVNAVGMQLIRAEAYAEDAVKKLTSLGVIATGGGRDIYGALASADELANSGIMQAMHQIAGARNVERGTVQPAKTYQVVAEGLSDMVPIALSAQAHCQEAADAGDQYAADIRGPQ